MANHPFRSNRFFRVCPRGFVNEVTYLRVPLAKVQEVEAYFADYEDRNPGSSAGWTKDRRATIPGVAVDWADRAHVGL